MLKIYSHGMTLYPREWPDDVFVVDVRHLPDPVSIRDLCDLDGRDPKVQQYMRSIGQVPTLLARVEREVKRSHGAYQAIAFGCYAGVHRSVALAEILGKKLGITPEHLDVEQRLEEKRRKPMFGALTKAKSQRQALLDAAADEWNTKTRKKSSLPDVKRDITQNEWTPAGYRVNFTPNTRMRERTIIVNVDVTFELPASAVSSDPTAYEVFFPLPPVLMRRKKEGPNQEVKTAYVSDYRTISTTVTDK